MDHPSCRSVDGIPKLSLITLRPFYRYPVLKPVIEERDSLTRKEKQYTSTKLMRTLGGQEFTSFAKHRNFNQGQFQVYYLSEKRWVDQEN